ncbi:shikimate dehydrogenase family protein (plasmid) [Roseomonas sp. CCTCC AB2023176]|uniref:shikimate dehydrogenase family protein n=1 Tax=Roseomonas sp. CCTCC AB2023176 TaxID=3342640 RepID=UPI0035E079CD
MTRVAVHLAHPADHVRTPGLFNTRCAERGVDAVLVPWDVMPAHLAASVSALRQVRNLAGVVVTMPHKRSVASLCDELHGDASALGACNVARKLPDGRLVGSMHDGSGFVAGLRRRGHDPRGRRALLVGAGGAASAVALALVAAGVARLGISNRTASVAAALVDRIRGAHPAADVAVVPPRAQGYDLVVNGTPLGMHANDPLPLDLAGLWPDTVVAEMIMQPDVTLLLHEAERLGAVAHRGVHMITEQIDLIIDALLAPPFPRDGETP